MTAPDLQQASAFLAVLDPSATTWTFQTFDDIESEQKRPELVKVLHGTLEQHAPLLASVNAQGAGIFVTVNEADGNGRKTENITRVRAVFADFDKADMATPERLRADTLPPAIIVESSPDKYHAYWPVDGLRLGNFKPLQKQIAQHWWSDTAVTDLPRVMRLPGFFHCKGEPRLVRLAETTGQRYSAAQLAARYPAPAHAAPAPREALPATPAGEISRYGASALESACKTIAGAEEGKRNHTLNREAFSIGQLVAGGDVPEALALSSLMEAASDSGLPDHEILSTLERSFSDGLKHPRTAPEQPKLDVGAAFRAAGAAIGPAPALNGLPSPQITGVFLGGRMLGYSKTEWIVGAVVGVGAVAMLFYLGRDSEPEAVSSIAPERASAKEVMECERRIKASVREPLDVDVKTLTGMSSDKQGAGGTSRVKLYFDIKSPDGSSASRQGVCQFAEGMPELLVIER